jgi:hypothetical protein
LSGVRHDDDLLNHSETNQASGTKAATQTYRSLGKSSRGLTTRTGARIRKSGRADFNLLIGIYEYVLTPDDSTGAYKRSEIS